MKYKDLRDFIALLEQRGLLKRITQEIDPYLEMTEIADRTLRTGGPALPAQTVLLALWLVEFGLIYNWVYPNLPNIGIPNVVAAALFAVLTLALRAWRTHRCNQLADARPWRDVVDSKNQ